MKNYSLLATLAISSLFAPGAIAATISLSAADINGGDTNRTNFDNGEVSITPFIGTTAATFNSNAARLGIDEGSNNAASFNDQDTDPNNGNEERLQIVFQTGSGLTQISWDFSRADGPGPDDGVFISGFSVDPGASLAGGGAVDSSSVNFSGGVLELDLAGADFGNPDGFLNLSNAAASSGQTLLITTTDTTQAGAQFAILGFEYDNAVIPEPSGVALLGVGLLGLIVRRRR